MSSKAYVRLPLILIVGISLIYGLWSGLLRLGWQIPGLDPQIVVNHGAWMISGVLGTLISLERAVALASSRRLYVAYSAPALTALGTVLLLSGMAPFRGVLLIALGSLVLTLVFIAVLRHHQPMHALMMGVAVGLWLAGNLLWAAGWPIYRMIYVWLGFLVLTIVAERLELSRVIRLSKRAEQLFATGAVSFLIAIAWATFRPQPGVRVLGLAEIALAAWLLRYDIARRTVRRDGITRYIAICLLVGYVWLAAGGALAFIIGPLPAGPLYDAVLHAVFLGFVFSMIFGHAPIILPALTGVGVAYSPRFYSHLALLHVSLLVRVAGDVTGSHMLRQWGGMFNVVAIILFLALTVFGVLVARRMRAGSNQDVVVPDQECRAYTSNRNGLKSVP